VNDTGGGPLSCRWAASLRVASSSALNTATVPGAQIRALSAA
jgi:hypothetical protein